MKELQICLVESSSFSPPYPRPKGLCKWFPPTLWVHRVGVQCKVAYLGGQTGGGVREIGHPTSSGYFGFPGCLGGDS